MHERRVVVDPRPFLNAEGDVWRFSFDVHRDMLSLLTSIWGRLRDAGASIPPMTYGKTWILFDPGEGRTIDLQTGDETMESSLDAAGIRPEMTLLVLSPASIPPAR